MKRDLASNIKELTALDPATINSNTTTNGNNIDTQGYHSATFLFHVGTVTDGDYTPLIEEADDDGTGSPDTFSAVADADLIGTEAGAAFTDDTDDNATSKIGYAGDKRWLRFSVVSTNATTGATSVGATAVLGHPQDAPVAQTN